MTDKYTALVNQSIGKNIARRLGLPQPALLRRFKPGQPLVTGPVLVQGNTAGADELAATLLSWDLRPPCEILDRAPALSPSPGLPRKQGPLHSRLPGKVWMAS